MLAVSSRQVTRCVMIHVVPSKVPLVVVALGSCRSGIFLCGAAPEDVGG